LIGVVPDDVDRALSAVEEVEAAAARLRRLRPPEDRS